MELIKSKGGNVVGEPKPAEGGGTVIAFVDDPDGYRFALIQRAPIHDPFAIVNLKVGDLDRAINFYEKVYWDFVAITVFPKLGREVFISWNW